MNKENTVKLLNSFPNLYSNYHANYRPERKVLFEFQCRDGWFQIIWDLSKKLEAEIEKLSLDAERTLPSAVQVKEKDGTLRFYMSGYTDAISAAIDEAVKRSAVTCEVCGQPGILRGKRWTYTLCEEHKDELIKKGAGW